MPEKLDPRLLDAVRRLETRSAGARGVGGDEAEPADTADTVVDVIVALAEPLDAASRRELLGRGLRLRSEIGDVVTGSLSLRDVRHVAASHHVRVIEASGPLYPDDTDPVDRASDATFDEGGGG